MKTAISIPDRVFREAERTAKRLKVSRSELYRRALEAFMARQSGLALKASYDEAYADAESDSESAFRSRAARKALLAIEWAE